MNKLCKWLSRIVMFVLAWMVAGTFLYAICDTIAGLWFLLAAGVCFANWLLMDVLHEKALLKKIAKQKAFNQSLPWDE